MRTEGGASIAKKLYVGTDLDVDGTTNLDVVDIDGAVDMATTLTLAGNADFNGDLDVDGTTETDALSINGTTITATAAELNYTDGVTSAIQTQLDTKATTGKAIAMALVFG